MKDFLSQIHTNFHSKSSPCSDLNHHINTITSDCEPGWEHSSPDKLPNCSTLFISSRLSLWERSWSSPRRSELHMQWQEKPCTWNLQQHLRSKHMRRTSSNGRLLPRCFCKKMERTFLSAFTGRSLTIQRYILKNKKAFSPVSHKGTW